MEGRRNRRSQVYELVVGLLGLSVGLFYLPEILQQNLLLTLFLFCLAVLLEVMPVPLGKVVSSLLIALPMGVMAVYGRGEAVCLMIVAELVVPMIERTRMRWTTVLFNAGQYALSTLVMVYVYQHFHESGHLLEIDWNTLIGVLCGCVSFVLVNHSFIHILTSIRGTFELSDILNLLYSDGLNVVIALPFSLLMIAVSPQHPLLGPVTMLPIVILGQTLRTYRRASFLQKVQSAAARLTSEFDVDKICKEVAITARRLTFADAVVMFVLDAEKHVLIPLLTDPEEEFASVHMPDGYAEADGGVIWQVIRGNGWVYVPDTRKDSRVRTFGDTPRFLSMAIFPMQTHGSVHGAIVCYAQRAYAFGELTEFISVLASQASVLLENAKLYQKLQDQSSRDGATGLYNYRYFYEALSDHFLRARQSQLPLSVVVVDVDYFKKFNDTYGHLAGDAVLRSLGQLLVKIAGPDAVVARYGGEEFGIILPYRAEQTMKIVERIRHEVSRHVVEFDGYHLQGITVSSGVASFPEHAMNDRELLFKADSAMYWGAKQRGRHKTALYSPEFDVQLFVDALTGLYTFHFLNIRIREEFSRGVTNWGAICIDLENFSNINNVFGFAAGDKVLKETSALIRDCLRQSELACRYGGDEFLVLLPNVSQTEIEVIADRIDKVISSYSFECKQNVVVPLKARFRVDVYQDLEDEADMFDRVGSRFVSLQQSTEEHFA